MEIIDLAREQIIKDQGEAAWKEIEKQIEAEVARLIAEGKIPTHLADQIKNLRGAALLAAVFGGRMAGFLLYIVVNQVFFAIARLLGLGIGVAIAGPIIGRKFAVLLGPVGWLAGDILLAYDLGNPNWGRVIPAVVFAIALRRRFQFDEEGMDPSLE